MSSDSEDYTVVGKLFHTRAAVGSMFLRVLVSTHSGSAIKQRLLCFRPKLFKFLLS